MRVAGPFDPRDPWAQAALISAAADRWGISVPAIGIWASTAARSVNRPAAARWSLEFDPRLRLVSFEVWSDGVCIYGADDIAQ